MSSISNDIFNADKNNKQTSQADKSKMTFIATVGATKFIFEGVAVSICLTYNDVLEPETKESLTNALLASAKLIPEYRGNVYTLGEGTVIRHSFCKYLQSTLTEPYNEKEFNQFLTVALAVEVINEGKHWHKYKYIENAVREKLFELRSGDETLTFESLIDMLMGDLVSIKLPNEVKHLVLADTLFGSLSKIDLDNYFPSIQNDDLFKTIDSESTSVEPSNGGKYFFVDILYEALSVL